MSKKKKRRKEEEKKRNIRNTGIPPDSARLSRIRPE
jgi:hypothetical protein